MFLSKEANISMEYLDSLSYLELRDHLDAFDYLIEQRAKALEKAKADYTENHYG